VRRADHRNYARGILDAWPFPNSSIKYLFYQVFSSSVLAATHNPTHGIFEGWFASGMPLIELIERKLDYDSGGAAETYRAEQLFQLTNEREPMSTDVVLGFEVLKRINFVIPLTVGLIALLIVFFG
jgi:hypothetical protein